MSKCFVRTRQSFDGNALNLHYRTIKHFVANRIEEACNGYFQISLKNPCSFSISVSNDSEQIYEMILLLLFSSLMREGGNFGPTTISSSQKNLIKTLRIKSSRVFRFRSAAPRNNTKIALEER